MIHSVPAPSSVGRLASGAGRLAEADAEAAAPGPITPPPVDWELSAPAAEAAPTPPAAPPSGEAARRQPSGNARRDGPDPFAIARSLPRVPYAVESLGPVGRRRRPLLIVAGAVLSLGLSAIAWAGRVNREMVEFDPRMHARPRRSAAALVLPVALAVGVAAAAVTRLLLVHLASTDLSLALGERTTRWFVAAPGALPLLCGLIPPSLGAVLLTLERVRVVEDRAGVAPERQLRPAAAVCWLLLPVVGLGAVMAVAQRRLNRVWSTSV